MSYRKLVLKDKETLIDKELLDHIQDGIAEAHKSCICRYDSTFKNENGQGALRIYIPCSTGYVNWNFVHTVHDTCDMWRLCVVYMVDGDLNRVKTLTQEYAEWEMALHIKDRDDFIGGSAHGDEYFETLNVFVDGAVKDITSITELTAFKELRITETSIGYDPADHTTQALTHGKEYIINENGITLNQKVVWTNAYDLAGGCYLAMCPPRRNNGTVEDVITNTLYTDVDYAPITLPADGAVAQTVNGATKACVYSAESGVSFTMAVPKYVTKSSGDYFFLTNNSGANYNKMYFVVAITGSVTAGETWETTTQYKIEW